MKRAGQLFERIAERDNLRLAFYKARQGKRTRADARLFAENLEDNLAHLQASLWDGSVRVGECHQFTLFDPKQRLITAPCFRERVLHHALTNVCEPVFERWLVDDSFACRVGKGRVAAVQRSREFSRRFPYCLQLDTRKYFDSIDHGILLERLERRFKDARLLNLFARIVRVHAASPGRGLPIGSLTSQHFANFYLGWFDRFVKEQLCVPGYVRYMDDCLLWDASKARLGDALAASRKFLMHTLRLELKGDPRPVRTARGIEFLGCRVYPTHLALNRRSRDRFRARLRTLNDELATGQIEAVEFQQRTAALVAFTTAGGTRSWRFRSGVLQRLSVDG